MYACLAFTVCADINVFFYISGLSYSDELCYRSKSELTVSFGEKG